MNSHNIAIIVLFLLVLIILWQFYCFRNGKSPEVYHPSSIKDIQDIVTSTVRTDPPQIITDKLNKILSLDTSAKEITVETGCTIYDICRYLEKNGLALDVVPDLDQTIGDACSTAASGSNLDTGSISDQIVSMDVVLASGNIRRVEFDDPEFPAFSTSLGSLGVVYTITLKCVDLYQVSTERIVGDWSSIKANLFNILTNSPLSKLYIHPETLQTTILVRKKIPPGTETEPYYKSLSRRSNAKSMVYIPYKRVDKAIDDMLKLCANHKKTGEQISSSGITVHFSGPDYNSWLSPVSGRESAIIEYRGETPLEAYEDLLLYKYTGRPEWSTSKFLNAYKIRLLYGISVDYHRKMRDRFDPNHTFANKFTRELL